MKKFSVIIPTYTGIDTIGGCISAVASQKTSTSFEVIIIQDGPNGQLEEAIRLAIGSLKSRKISVVFKKLKRNMGRFEARKNGAKYASTEHLLFLDDRIEFDDTYFDKIANFEESASIPNVIERPSSNFISLTIYRLRKKIVYRNKYEKFETTYITNSNFETSPKGTTSLWVTKTAFLDACEDIEKEMSKYTNEDTKLFRSIIEKGNRILRNSNAIIYYHPRQSAMGELVHIYHRGPRFIDYYLKPGTRFFWPLVAIGVSPFFILLLGILLPQALFFLPAGAILATIIVSLYAMGKFSDFVAMLLGLPLLTASFYVGILAGFMKKLKG